MKDISSRPVAALAHAQHRQMSSNRAFNSGIEYFRQARYAEALKAFDQAILENDKDHSHFDSRAAVLEKLYRPLDALKDSKKVIDLEPSSWKGYWRSARLFSELEKHGAALKMVDLALERLKDGDVKRRQGLEELRSRALKALEPLPCYFSRLPVEMQVEILSNVVEGSIAKMLALMLVCRSWRHLIVDSPNFWRHLIITPKTRQKKVDTWLERARGILSSLRITGDFTFAKRPNVFRNAAEALWSALELLEISGDIGSILPPGACRQLRLRSLTLNAAPRFPEVGPIICSMDGSRMSTLTLRVNLGFSFNDLPFTKLTLLEIRGAYMYSQIVQLIRRNSMLQTLILMNNSLGPPPPDDNHDGDHAELAELLYLRLLGLESASLLNFIRASNLKSLGITSAFYGSGVRCIDALLRWKPIHLEELSLSKCAIEPAALIALLQDLRFLRTLQLSKCDSRDDAINSILEVLAKPVEIGGHASLCCPLLQNVDLSSTHDLKTGPVVRLVKSRLSAQQRPDDSQSHHTLSQTQSPSLPLSIVHLNLENCPLIEEDALAWLRGTVPELRCKMKVEKASRRIR